MRENNFCANLYWFLRDVESLSLTLTYASQFDRFILSGELTSKWPKFQQICSDGKSKYQNSASRKSCSLKERRIPWKRNFDICLTLAYKFADSLQGVTYSMVCALNCRSYPPMWLWWTYHTYCDSRGSSWFKPVMQFWFLSQSYVRVLEEP